MTAAAVVAALCVVGGLAAAGSAGHVRSLSGLARFLHLSTPAGHPAAAPGTVKSRASGQGPPPSVPREVLAGNTYQTADGVAAGWVTAENTLPGTGAWNITGPQTPDGIMGYSNLVQAQVGQVVTLYVSTRAPSFHVEAYRMGYYQGLGGRLIWTSPTVAGVVQPSCPADVGTNMVHCNWQSSVSFTLTNSWVQGQYLLKLVGSGGQQGYVPFTVWDPTSRATYVIMSGVLTDQAFNAFGGYDLYQGATPCAPQVYPCSTRARVVSFDRPYAEGDGASSYLTLEYPLTRFAEMHGLDVTYWTDITLSTNGNLLTDHKVLISPGHDEEWSLEMRQATEAASSRGVNLIFFGASPVLRKVRLEPSALGPDREMVNYRDPASDPLMGVDNAEVSQNWWGQLPADRPDSDLVGADYVGYYNEGSFPLVVSEPSSWLFAGTGLGADSSIPGVLTGDFQAYDPALGGTPAGVQILSHSHVSITGNPDRHYADTTYYTMPSGAGVFSSGTTNWITTLQPCTPAETQCASPLMQAITGNLLRVFGAGPAGNTYPSVSNVNQFYG
jgi:hypothetical protein